MPVSELKVKRCVRETNRESLRIPRYAVPPDTPRLALDIGRNFTCNFFSVEYAIIKTSV